MCTCLTRTPRRVESCACCVCTPACHLTQDAARPPRAAGRTPHGRRRARPQRAARPGPARAPGDARAAAGVATGPLGHFSPFRVLRRQVEPRWRPQRAEVVASAQLGAALERGLPGSAAYPFPLRVTAEALAADGGALATAVTAASLALGAAGVPQTRPVAGARARPGGGRAGAASPAARAAASPRCDAPAGRPPRRWLGARRRSMGPARVSSCQTCAVLGLNLLLF